MVGDGVVVECVVLSYVGRLMITFRVSSLKESFTLKNRASFSLPNSLKITTLPCIKQGAKLVDKEPH